MRPPDAGRELPTPGSQLRLPFLVCSGTSLPTVPSLCHFICNYLALMPCEGRRPLKGLGVHLSALTRAASLSFAFRFGC